MTIVVVNRNGAHHLRRLLRSLSENTQYRSFDLVVVDNGSTDESIGLLTDEGWPFSIDIIRNDKNMTFSQANNQGIAKARGEYVLLLNNDVEPINSTWLSLLVQALESDQDLSAVGALLIYPSRQFSEEELPAHPDLSIQHAGVAFDWRRGRIRAHNIASGGDPLRRDRAATRRRPAVTAACLLTSTANLTTINGFSEGYVYGSEDWDLCLRLRSLGDIAIVGSSALFHHEYGTQNDIRPAIVELNRRHNRDLFIDQWGARLNREMRLDLINHHSFWVGNRAGSIAIVTAKHDAVARNFGDALDRRGWSVMTMTPAEMAKTDTRHEMDYVITDHPDTDWSKFWPQCVRIAWIRGSWDDWAESPDVDRFTAALVSDPTQADRVERFMGMKPLIFLPAVAPSSAADTGDALYESDVLVIGDYASSPPKLADTIDLSADERLIVVGAGWEVEPRLAKHSTPQMSPDEIDSLTMNAGLVFHPSIPKTAWQAAEGSLRALALGALPVTNSFEISQWLFDGELPVIAKRDDLRRVLSTMPPGSEARARTLDALRTVAANHTYVRRAAEFDALMTELISRPSVALNISPHNRDVAESWGDTHFARQLARAFRRVGFQTRINILPQWEASETQDADIVIHLRGLHPATPKPGAVNVLWVISHPDDVTAEECEKYDIVFAASEMFATKLRNQVNVPVHVLLQATDPDVFHPGEPDPMLHHEVLFVGNARWPARIAPRWAMEVNLPLVIYGKNWENFPENAHVADSYFPNANLGSLYRSAEIVLNDHWPDMKASGFLSNRLFDVLGAGGLVVSDYIDGIEEVFDGSIPTYESAADLQRLVTALRNDPAERARLSIRGMQLVHQFHTFDVRVREMVCRIAEIAPTIPLTVEGSEPFDLKALAAGFD